MENEKINVFVPKETAEILEKDARLFEIFKRDGVTVNMNHFLSRLLIGYYDMYTEAYEKMCSQIASVLEEIGLQNAAQRSAGADLVIKKAVFSDPPKKKGLLAKRISLKPTASTLPILINIERNLTDDTMSRYLCRLFTSYTQKPTNERERIIFKSTYDLLQRANKARLLFSFMLNWDANQIHEVLPYSIEISKEELHNYLLCQEYIPERKVYEARTYRLNRISQGQISVKSIPFDKEVQRHLDLMKHYGPQYPINDDEECCVRLSEEGVHLFNRIYFGRPVVDRIEKKDNMAYYYFRCSQFQLYTYFRRFDRDHAIIVYPEALRLKMIESYQTALDTYASLTESQLRELYQQQNSQC